MTEIVVNRRLFLR